MSASIWTPANNDNGAINHILILGSPDKGRSSLIVAEAMRLGISYEELEQRLGPTEEQKERLKIQENAEERKEELRIQRVREVVWEAWSEDKDAFDRLHDALISIVLDKSPTREQLRAVFMMLPARIIGLGISWSFDDTEVGDEMYRFIEDNKEAVAKQLADVMIQG